MEDLLLSGSVMSDVCCLTRKTGWCVFKHVCGGLGGTVPYVSVYEIHIHRYKLPMKLVQE